MVAALAVATNSDPLVLFDVLFSRPDLFDALWYSAFLPKDVSTLPSGNPKSDIDEILER